MQIIEHRQKEYNENEAKIMEEEVNETEENNVYTTQKRRAFLDMLLYNWHRGDLTTDDIQEEVDTFMFAVNIGKTFTYYRKTIFSKLQWCKI